MNDFGARYHQGVTADNRQVDELMIANMLNALNNMAVFHSLNGDEQEMLIQVVKNHVVMKAQMALEVQNAYLNNNGRTR